jgi:predicted metal-dependent phosphoesterase TrpH
MMRIDLHVHTQERSFCARSSEEDQIRAAITLGLDGLVITDHDRLVAEEHLTYLNAKYAPFRVFGGIEVSLGMEHVLVLGIHDDALECRSWSYPALHSFVEEHNGFLALAHPFRFTGDINIDVEQCPPHALEVHSHNTPPQAEPRIRELAQVLNIPMLANSDAHSAGEIGDHYNVLADDPHDERELVKILKAGSFELVAPG